MSDNSGVKPISEKFLDNGDLFGMQFNQGYVFLEVESFEQLKYAPFSQSDTVDANSSSNFGRLDDPDGDDVLYLERDQAKVMHASIGHSPAVLRRYTNYPEGETRLRRHSNLGVPVPGDDYGWWAERGELAVWNSRDTLDLVLAEAADEIRVDIRPWQPEAIHE